MQVRFKLKQQMRPIRHRITYNQKNLEVRKFKNVIDNVYGNKVVIINLLGNDAIF